MNELTYEQLRDSVAGAHVALRSRVELAPAGGAGDKVFPPTYGVADSADHKYADEKRTIGLNPDGSAITTTAVLLNSVASEAKRLGFALREALELGELTFPNPYVDFSGQDGLADLDRISTLEASHRVADALFRDSLLDGTLFRLSDIGRAITEARPDSATAMLRYCPTALLFGVWDSTGPKGGLGSKFQRAIVSEIVGLGAQVGRKVGSRIDVLGIESSVVIYESKNADEGWTLDENEAVQDKGKPKPFDRKGVSDKPGRPSKVNHGNVTPKIDPKSGGVTIDSASQVAVLSFAALRKLRFPTDANGQRVDPSNRRAAETAARSAVAALGVAALAYQVEMDYDLRSRCLLVPTGPQRFELLSRDGSEPTVVDLSREGAARIVAEAARALAERGMAWESDEIRLEPAPKLAELIRRSRQNTAAAGDQNAAAAGDQNTVAAGKG